MGRGVFAGENKAEILSWKDTGFSGWAPNAITCILIREAEGHLTPLQGEADVRVSREREKILTPKRGAVYLQIKGPWKS